MTLPSFLHPDEQVLGGFLDKKANHSLLIMIENAYFIYQVLL